MRLSLHLQEGVRSCVRVCLFLWNLGVLCVFMFRVFVVVGVKLYNSLLWKSYLADVT